MKRNSVRKGFFMGRLTRFREKMKLFGADAALISSNVNIRYLSGLDYTDGYVLITARKAYLLADFRYIEAAKERVPKDEFEIIMPDTSMSVCLASLLDENEARSVAFEDKTLSFSDFERFKRMFGDKELIPGASEMADELRLYKDESEFEAIIKAQSITDAAYKHILEVLTPDMTEIDAALELEFYMRKHGSEGTAFETIAVSGTASSRPHGVPRNVRLEKGFFTMDFGAKVDGYCSDMTRTVVLGKADADMKRLYRTVLEAQLAALDFIREGICCRDADLVARNIIDNAGYRGCFGHNLGHGVGMYIHESPSFARRVPENIRLERGNVVTVEPGIYIEGRYGCRIEDMIGVKPDGSIFNFTHSPKELTELF